MKKFICRLLCKVSLGKVCAKWCADACCKK